MTTLFDPFPPSDFDDWAADYDRDVAGDGFPFTGYAAVLDEVVRLADVRPGMTVLDLGAGTGNLAARFAGLGCAVWGVDFSAAMLERARVKAPACHFVLHDLRAGVPPELDRPFDRIVSAYTFHHFDLPEKVAMLRYLHGHNLVRGGRLVIADISFPTEAARDAYAEAAGELWEDEPYWIAEDALGAFEYLGMAAAYVQVSACAGVYVIERR